MSLEEAYAAMGGNLNQVRACLLTDERIAKYARMFLEDGSMRLFEDSLQAGNLSEAFRGAHTLKGLSLDLGFTALFEAASKMSDALRPNDAGEPAAPERVETLAPQLRDAYKLTIDAIALI